MTLNQVQDEVLIPLEFYLDQNLASNKWKFKNSKTNISVVLDLDSRVIRFEDDLNTKYSIEFIRLDDPNICISFKKEVLKRSLVTLKPDQLDKLYSLIR